MSQQTPTTESRSALTGSVVADKSTLRHPRQAHPLAKAVYDVLRGAAGADRRHVLMAARGCLVKGRPETVQICVNAMHATLGSKGRLSRGAYDRWRQEQSVPSEWPSSQLIANTFGSWARAKEVAGETSLADVMARRLVEKGRALSHEEILAGMKLYAETGDPLTLTSYIAWAKKEMQREDRQLDRFARSASSINRVFGSWGDLIIEAGLAERLAAERHPGYDPPGSPRDYTVDRVTRWLTEAAPECGDRLMTRGRYDRWASARTSAALKDGRRLVIPRSATAMRYFESWPHALAAAGLISEEEAAERRGKRGRFKSRAFLAERLAEALQDLGPRPTCAEYQEWRRLQQIFKTDASRMIPVCNTLASRFGGWGAALEAARRRHGGRGVSESPLLADEDEVRR
jgi:hypothetical protein